MSNSVPLHALVLGEHRALEELLDETGGEFTPEIEALLTELDLKIDEKLERVGLYYKSQLQDAERAEELAKAYIARAQSFRKGAEGLKGYASRMMEVAGRVKLKSALVTLYFQSNPPSVKGELGEEQLRELAVIEPSLVRHKPEVFELDRRAALELHKSGQSLPDGLTVEASRTLRIR